MKSLTMTRVAIEWAFHLATSSEGGPPFCQAYEPEATGIGASDAVVANLDLQRPILRRCPNRHSARLRVLYDVRKPLGDHEVRVRLDLRREALIGNVDLDRQIHPLRHRSHACPQTTARKS